MTKSAQNAVHGPRRFDRCIRRSRAAGQSLIVSLVLLGFLTAVMGTGFNRTADRIEHLQRPA